MKKVNVERTEDEVDEENENNFDSNALRSFLVGEEKIEERVGLAYLVIRLLFKFLRSILRICQIYYGLYDPKIVAEDGYNHNASALLLQVCSRRLISVFNIVNLLEVGGDPDTVSERNGQTLLHLLCRKGNYLGVLYLIKAGADINKVNNFHQTPIMLASDTKRVESHKIVELLAKQPNIKIEVRDSGGNTALMSAIFKNNAWITRSLLLAGALVTDSSPACPSGYEIALWVLATGVLVISYPFAALNNRYYCVLKNKIEYLSFVFQIY